MGRCELGLSADVVTALAMAPSSGLGGGASGELPLGVSGCMFLAELCRCTPSTKSWMLLCVPCTQAHESRQAVHVLGWPGQWGLWGTVFECAKLHVLCGALPVGAIDKVVDAAVRVLHASLCAQAGCAGALRWVVVPLGDCLRCAWLQALGRALPKPARYRVLDAAAVCKLHMGS